MGIGVSGGGFVGLAFESTPGTYVAPTRYHPVLSEALEWQPGTIFRRPIRQSVDQIGAVPGNVGSTGTLSMEALDDILVYYLYAMRMGIVKTGSSPNFTYTATPTSTNAFPTRTLSLTVIRNSQVFGYVGCVVSKMTLAIQNDLLQCDCDILFQNEAVQSLPAPTWVTETPYGPGTWSVQIPTATQIFDLDTFSLSIDEAGASAYRLKNTGPNQGRGAQFISMGERTIQMTASRDFIDRTDYNAFQAVTPQNLTIQCAHGGNNSIAFNIPNAFKSAMQTPLSAQGDIIRSSLTYDSTIDGSGNAIYLTIQTQENIT